MKKLRKLPKPRNPVAKHARKFNRVAIIPAKKGRGTVYKRTANPPIQDGE